MIVMRGKGLVVIFVFTLIMFQVPMPIDAGHSGRKLTWNSGLQIDVDVENIDYWATESVSKLFFTLKLLNAGIIEDFKTLVMQVTVVTEVNYTEIITVNNPWNSVGDVSKVVAEFTISSEDISGTGWDTYEAMFYYNLSVFADIPSYTDVQYWTYAYEGTPLTISTLSYIVFWPFPPIILVGSVFWILYFVVRKFNKRYEDLESEQVENTVSET